MCGIFAIYSKKGVNISLLINVLNDLKHRGKDSYGISFIEHNQKKIKQIKSLEKLNKNDYNSYENTINLAITHNRYSTNTGKSIKHFENEIQPISVKNDVLEFDLAHNGNITNLSKYIGDNVDNELSDTQNIVKLFSNEINLENALIKFINKVHCSYSIVILTKTEIYAFKDRYGYKPLCIGNIGENFCISSEDCIKNFTKIKEIKNGELVKINDSGYKTIYEINKQNKSSLKCVFEYIYFMNKTTTSCGDTIYNIRKKLGKKLASLETTKFDSDTIVVGSPNTAIPMGIGYAAHLNLPYKQVLLKHKNCERTFILKDQQSRQNECRKFSICENIKNKVIILVDDSIVRGNTIQSLTKLFYKNGCKELHVRICSPELKYTCNYGIDIPTKKELVINNYSIEEIKNLNNMTSLKYLSVNEMLSVFNEKNGGFCSACFDGNYNKELEW